jgi:hypothetical protein
MAMNNPLKRSPKTAGAAEITDPGTLYRYEGTINRDSPGWTFVAKEEKTRSFNQFEGVYANKGGRLLGPAFAVKEQEFAFMKLTFAYKTPEPAYAGLFFYDANGHELPDFYEGLDPTETFAFYETIFYGRHNSVDAKPFFQSLAGITVKNVRIETISEQDAASWCDHLYATLPPLAAGSLPNNRLCFLPKTVAAMKTGKPWRVVMLGDSIVNDTFNSGFQALLKRLYPQSALHFICSVRGSTGCWFYHEPENFQEYVARHRPDLLIIGGISNFFNRSESSFDEALRHIREVAKRARNTLNCEVMLLTGPLGLAWREGGDENQQVQAKPYEAPIAFWQAEAKLAEELKIAFQDQASWWRTYLKKSSRLGLWFNRDSHHGNARGKQIVGRMLETFFDSNR